MQSTEWLQWICSSQNFDQLKEKYDQWADNYEDNINHVYAQVPFAAAALLAKYTDKDALILDAGAGTGLAGEALSTLGFKNLIALDLSPAMLSKAKSKGVYQHLICAPINTASLTPIKNVQAIIATGVFAEAHAGAEELKALQACLPEGGIVVFTARTPFLSDLQTVLQQTNWTKLESIVLPIYEDPMHVMAYRIANIS